MKHSRPTVKGRYDELPGESRDWLKPSGETPFARGIHPTARPERPWTIRQYAGFSSASETNAHYRDLLAKGQTGLSVAFDLPTHLGMDSDHPAASGEVGKTGVAVDSVEDMKALFDGIDLGKVSVSMTMNGAVLPILACFIVAAEESGIDPEQLKGTIQNDILKEFSVRNTFIHPARFSMRVVSDIVAFCSTEMPRFNSMSISGYHFQEAGAPPALELALTLLNAKAYLSAFEQRGMDLANIARQLSFFFCIGMDFYAEIAKLRAARMLWSELLGEFGVDDARASKMRIHCQTSGVSLRETDPLNNIVRTTVEAMAGVFGGTQSLHTNSYDEALSLPTQQASDTALATQTILQRETGIADVMDPWGGSFMMESLTGEMADTVRALMQDIESRGDIVELCENGVISEIVHREAVRHAARQGVADASDTTSPETDYRIRRIDTESLRLANKRRLARLKLTRDQSEVARRLADIGRAVADGDNLMPAVIAAIRARATVGECVQVLAQHHPRHSRPECIAQGELECRVSPDLRAPVDRITRHIGRAPRVLVTKVGLDGHDRGAKLIASWFGDLGFEVDYAPIFTSVADIRQRLRETQYDCLGLSILSGAHLEVANELSSDLRCVSVSMIGGIIPEQDREPLERLGFDLVFTPRSGLEAVATQLLSRLELRMLDQASSRA